jgi:sugar/nucleoside kinase (ribokinase family)
MDQGPMNSWNPSKSFRYDRKYDWIHFSTGPPNEYIAIAKTAVGGSRITFDPGQEINYMYSRNNLEEFLSLSSLVIANSSEIQKMSSIMDMTPDRMLEEFPDYIITRGAEGVTYSFNGRERHMEAVPATRVVDTVGAGDAFRAGFYYGLNAGDTPEESIKVGQIVASKVVSSSPVDFRREMIKDILD